MSAQIPRVEVLDGPLQDSPHFEAADAIIAQRFWPLSEPALERMRKGSATVLSFDEADALNGVAIVLFTPGMHANSSEEVVATLSFLASASSEGTDEARQSDQSGKPLNKVIFSEIDNTLLAAAEEVARARGYTVLETVGITCERAGLEAHGYVRKRNDTSFMAKPL